MVERKLEEPLLRKWLVKINKYMNIAHKIKHWIGETD